MTEYTADDKKAFEEIKTVTAYYREWVEKEAGKFKRDNGDDNASMEVVRLIAAYAGYVWLGSMIERAGSLDEFMPMLMGELGDIKNVYAGNIEGVEQGEPHTMCLPEYAVSMSWREAAEKAMFGNGTPRINIGALLAKYMPPELAAVLQGGQELAHDRPEPTQEPEEDAVEPMTPGEVEALYSEAADKGEL